MSYYRSPAVSPSVIPKNRDYYQSDEEETYVSPARRLGVFQRRTTPTIYDYSRRGNLRDEYGYDEDETEDEDEGEYTRGTPVVRSPRLYQPPRYRSYPRNNGYSPRRIEF
ncbi:Hypothetical protein BQ3484_190 [Cedratvirus A11]|uniref:Uncharacterized protein n=1 Tax=Cedratvirus A11 TaxID=1903266 RepID=A0A1M7XUQ1_9VIRU|nr:Hypothetical protein BQ3484_190 [Cedratvirus A11]SHO33258.1 Hypothetical protein BQ3484_190 [Cedratvirus A11]